MSLLERYFVTLTYFEKLSASCVLIRMKTVFFFFFFFSKLSENVVFKHTSQSYPSYIIYSICPCLTTFFSHFTVIIVKAKPDPWNHYGIFCSSVE